MFDLGTLHHVTQDELGFEQQVFESLPGHIVSSPSQDDFPVEEVFSHRLLDVISQQHSSVLAGAAPDEGQFKTILVSALLVAENGFDHGRIGYDLRAEIAYGKVGISKSRIAVGEACVCGRLSVAR